MSSVGGSYQWRDVLHVKFIAFLFQLTGWNFYEKTNF